MTTQARILIAEDEAPLRSLVRMSLEAIGHHVTTVGDGEEALKAFASEPFDLVILDIMMPLMDGFDVCREIRTRSDVPIIMLTALGGTDDMVKGFEMGADDYIAKPFSFKEVQARIHAILRRNQWIQERKAPLLLQNGSVTLDVEGRQVSVDGEPIHVTPIEFKLLYTLMANAGKVLSKNDLFVDVWGYEFIGGTNLVEVTIRRLREKIEPAPSHPVYILTVRGTGYKFRAAE
ncbi:MAG TPA: response regulator transcription factor [Anaerolineae bacterium]|nr:response regulator transcription factor [Anaerolineae bacterium]